ncbi:hypothetical protein H477_2312 [[Clostridium] sordellii ATCC 9714]|nr:hypothetical protein H477_2312 [[Clostridium] sordellii ATCC 9714] [Paeniclostridium sordellii ATCC 9714]
METREGVNYVFRYNKDSIAEKYIDKIIETQEFCYEFICKYLDVKMNDRIHYYLCESPEHVGQIYGDNDLVMLLQANLIRYMQFIMKILSVLGFMRMHI